MTEEITIKNDWYQCNLGEICNFVYGKNLPGKDRVTGNIPVYGSNGVVGFHDKALVLSPGIVVGRKGSAGVVHFSKIPFYPIDTTFYISQNDTKVDLMFLFYLLKEIDLKKLKADVGVPGINREMVHRERVSIPNNIEQQKAIAEVLTAVQSSIYEQENLLAKLIELKRSMMQHLFTNGTKGEKTKMTEIGEIPESWEVVVLGSLCEETVGGGTPSTKNCQFWIGKTPWITSKWLDNDLYLRTGEKFISEEAVRKSATHIIPAHSIIFATRVGVGKASINTIDLAINQDLAGLITTGINKEFLVYQLRGDRIQKHINSIKRGATIQGITREDMKKILIAKSSDNEQCVIAESFVSIDRKIETIQEKLTIYHNLFRTLLHELISGERKIKV